MTHVVTINIGQTCMNMVTKALCANKFLQIIHYVSCLPCVSYAETSAPTPGQPPSGHILTSPEMIVPEEGAAGVHARISAGRG